MILGVRTCELFLCFAPFVFLGSIASTSLFPLFYVTREFFRFLQQGDRGGTNEKKQGKKFSRLQNEKAAELE